MGQKCHPYGLRLGIIRPWLSNWYAGDEKYRDQLLEDIRLRKFIREQLQNAAIAQIFLERTANDITVTIHTARPGVVIGRGGRGVDQLRQRLEKLTRRRVQVNVEEVKKPELDGLLVAESIANQIERRISFRRAMRQAITRTMRAGAQGCRVQVSGRLGGAEIAHSEVQRSPEGRVPLHTLRADVSYGLAEARTNYGYIGVKVWIYRGDILPEPKKRPEPVPEKEEEVAPAAAEAEAPVEPEAAQATESEAPGPAAEVAVSEPTVGPATAPEAAPGAVEAPAVPETEVPAEAVAAEPTEDGAADQPVEAPASTEEAPATEQAAEPAPVEPNSAKGEQTDAPA